MEPQGESAYAWLRQQGAVGLGGEKTSLCPVALEDSEIPFRDADVLMGLAAHGFVVEKPRAPAPVSEPLFVVKMRGGEAVGGVVATAGAPAGTVVGAAVFAAAATAAGSMTTAAAAAGAWA